MIAGAAIEATNFLRPAMHGMWNVASHLNILARHESSSTAARWSGNNYSNGR